MKLKTFVQNFYKKRFDSYHWKDKALLIRNGDMVGLLTSVDDSVLACYDTNKDLFILYERWTYGKVRAKRPLLLKYLYELAPDNTILNREYKPVSGMMHEFVHQLKAIEMVTKEYTNKTQEELSTLLEAKRQEFRDIRNRCNMYDIPPAEYAEMMSKLQKLENEQYTLKDVINGRKIKMPLFEVFNKAGDSLGKVYDCYDNIYFNDDAEQDDLLPEPDEEVEGAIPSSPRLSPNFGSVDTSSLRELRNRLVGSNTTREERNAGAQGLAYSGLILDEVGEEQVRSAARDLADQVDLELNDVPSHNHTFTTQYESVWTEPDSEPCEEDDCCDEIPY